MEGLIHIPGLDAASLYTSRFEEYSKIPDKNQKKNNRFKSTEQTIKKVGKTVGKGIKKGYMGAGNFIANNNEMIGAGFNIIPNPDTTLNSTELISGQVYDKASDWLMTNPTTALLGLGMKGAKKADLLSTATDFNDKDTGLNFFQHAGNFLTSLTPGSKLFSTKINPVDKSRLNGIASYTWYNDLDKYNNKGKPFYVTFGGKEMKKAANDYQLAVNTAIDISDEGARAMSFDPYQVAKKSEQELRGGFDSKYGLLPTGKQGAVLQFTKRTLSKSKISKYQAGKPIVRQTSDGNFEIELERTPKYEEWLKQENIPQEYIGDNYDLELLYNTATQEKDLGHPELWDRLQKWVFAVTRPTEEERNYYLDMTDKDENGKEYFPYHLGSVIEEYDENGEPTGNYVFLKLGLKGQNPELDEELNWYNSDEANEFKKMYELDSLDGRYYYKLKDPKKFKEGGKVNVIPSGALHARKHNLTKIAEDGEKFEDVTTKGIPVVIEDENGNLIQQAEVEREEIIFRLEVTKKLEELAKEHTDKAAIEAGKLLVKEILYNTVDNTQEMI